MNADRERPRISVCVATYNQERYIKECVLSILAQSCDADIEILIGDDHSKDSTKSIILEIAAKHPDRVVIPKRARNLGASANYQDLISRATGDFIAHMDGDDYWMPSKLAEQMNHFQKHPECVAVYTNAHVIDDGGGLVGSFNNAQPEFFDTDYLLQKGNFLNHSSTVYRSEFKDCILELSGEFIDYRMHLRLAQQGKLGYVNKDLVAYRAGSATSMIRHIPKKVHDLYWEAISDAGIQAQYKKGKRAAQIHFYGRILYNSARRLDFAYAGHWTKRIKKEMPGSFWPILFRSLLLMPAIFLSSARRKIATYVTGYNGYPLYER